MLGQLHYGGKIHYLKKWKAGEVYSSFCNTLVLIHRTNLVFFDFREIKAEDICKHCIYRLNPERGWHLPKRVKDGR